MTINNHNGTGVERVIFTRRGHAKGPPGTGAPLGGETPPKPWSERWKEVRAAFGNVPRAFDLVWKSHRGATVAMA